MAEPPATDDSTAAWSPHPALPAEAEAASSAGPSLLAVDLGLRSGLAVYARDGRLVRYRSTHFPTVGALKKALPRVIDEAPGLAWLVCEGDRHYASIWARLAEKRGARVLWASAERWRPVLLTPAERTDGAQAKASAERLARQVIAVSGARRPTSLTHDVAEAILIGLWGALEVGWITALPPGLGREAMGGPSGPLPGSRRGDER